MLHHILSTNNTSVLLSGVKANLRFIPKRKSQFALLHCNFSQRKLYLQFRILLKFVYSILMNWIKTQFTCNKKISHEISKCCTECFYNLLQEAPWSNMPNKRNDNKPYTSDVTKGQLISKCPFGVIVLAKIPTKCF